MGTLSILILEDKALLAEALAIALQRIGYSVFGIASSADEALHLIKDSQPDLALLDIDLGEGSGEMNGIDVGRHINKHYDFPFIFLTGKDDELTLERSTEVNPTAFLLKPASDRSLRSTIQVAVKSYRIGKEASVQSNGDPQASDPSRDHLFVRYRGRFEKILQEDILWVEADESYSKIQTDSKSYTVTFILKVMEERLSHPKLVRVHRSYIVNVERVDAIEENNLMIGQKTIPVSKTYRHELRKHFNML